MTTTKEFIRNRKEQKLAVLVERQDSQKGLAFVMHGQAGFKEQPHIRTFIEAFLDSGFTVVSFDAANTIGESEGKMEDASITTYYEDLEDVIKWAESQRWYEEPFVLAGHSLGGICTALFAEKYPTKLKALAPISTVVSGKLSYEATPKEEIEDWRKTGWRTWESRSKPGALLKLKWSSMEDRLKYDLLPEAHKLNMPVLLIVGEKDTGTPLEHQQLLYDKLPGRKEIHVIQGVDHAFRIGGDYSEQALQEIKQIFDKWIKSLDD